MYGARAMIMILRKILDFGHQVTHFLDVSSGIENGTGYSELASDKTHVFG
jgi:hypothetical protein